jgi:hypothetical protein
MSKRIEVVRCVIAIIEAIAIALCKKLVKSLVEGVSYQQLRTDTSINVMLDR